MAHRSEDCKRLELQTVDVNGRALSDLDVSSPDVWFVHSSLDLANDSQRHKHAQWTALSAMASRMQANAVLALLLSPYDAANAWPFLASDLKFQLWVAVRLTTPVDIGLDRMPQHHAALLILSKYHSSLRHTKTRIQYTYCPHCDRTTKDYGGKKHTYHEYGTLMSDVWRDVAWSVGEPPDAIANRLADLFGLDPHRRLNIVNLDKSADVESVDAMTERGSPVHSSRRPQIQSCEVGNDDQPRLAEASKSELLHGDCLEYLRNMPSDSVDFCFADPPYNLAKRYDSCDDALDIREYFEWCDEWLDQLSRVLCPGRTCAVLNIPLWAIRHFEFLKTKLQYQNWLAWEGLSLPVRMIMPAHYSIICFSKGTPRPLPGRSTSLRNANDESALNALRQDFCLRASCAQNRRALGVEDHEPSTDLWWDIHRLKHNSKRVDHPCQLPPALMNRLVAMFTYPGETVLDPFDGSGTTTLCAHGMGRGYVGIELSEQYHRLAVERHALLDRGGDPFAKTTVTPQAKNSRVKRIGGKKYEVPKKVLQLEVKALAKRLGRLPTRDEVAATSQYPIRYFDEYFLSWGEVCAAARTTGMTESRSDSLIAKNKGRGRSGRQRMLFGERDEGEA